MQPHGIMLRRTKAGVLDLPPRVRTCLGGETEDGGTDGRDAAGGVFEGLRPLLSGLPAGPGY